MVNQIVLCDWLPKQARAILCARDYCRVPLENLSKSQTINPILTKFFGQDGWTLASFMDCDSVLVQKHAKKELQWPISSHLDQKSLVNKPCISTNGLLTNNHANLTRIEKWESGFTIECSALGYLALVAKFHI